MPKFQHRHYEAIAATIVTPKGRIVGDETTTGDRKINQLRGVRRTAAHLADALGSTNPRFDKTRFLKACGHGA